MKNHYVKGRSLLCDALKVPVVKIRLFVIYVKNANRMLS
jgi:hypothetical protein